MTSRRANYLNTPCRFTCDVIPAAFVPVVTCEYNLSKNHKMCSVLRCSLSRSVMYQFAFVSNPSDSSPPFSCPEF